MNTAEKLNIELERTKCEQGMSWYGGVGNFLSVTTVISYGAPENKKLSNWYKKNSYKKVETTKQLTAEEGTAMHDAVEKYIKGEKQAISDDMYKKMGGFLDWAEKNELKPFYTEQVLASEKYGFAGRCDFIGELNGKLVVLDWKNTRHYRITNGWQLAAYRRMAVELGLVDKDCGMVGVQINRLTGVVKTFEYQHIDFCDHAFLHALENLKAHYFNYLDKVGWKWLKKPIFKLVEDE